MGLLLFLVVVGVIAANAWSVVQGRRGATRMHDRAFGFGLAGLCGIPLLLVAIGALFVGALATGVGLGTYVVSAVACLLTVVGTCVSVVSALLARRRPSAGTGRA